MACNGDTTTLPKSFTDLTGTMQSTQFPAGAAPNGTGAVVLSTGPVLIGCTNTEQESVKRIDAHQGTVLVTADYVLSAGWGTTPTFTAIRGTDQAATFSIQAKA